MANPLYAEFHKKDEMANSLTAEDYQILCLGQKKNLVSGYPTNRPTQTFFEALWDIKVYFKTFKVFYIFFHTQKFYKKCLPTYQP